VGRHEGPLNKTDRSRRPVCRRCAAAGSRYHHGSMREPRPKPIAILCVNRDSQLPSGALMRRAVAVCASGGSGNVPKAARRRNSRKEKAGAFKAPASRQGGCRNLLPGEAAAATDTGGSLVLLTVDQPRHSRVLNTCPSVSIDIPNANGANVGVDMSCVTAGCASG
jgi:hypothetical protein